MTNSRPEIQKAFYALDLDTPPEDLKRQRKAEIERMIEAKVAQALRRLRP